MSKTRLRHDCALLHVTLSSHYHTLTHARTLSLSVLSVLSVSLSFQGQIFAAKLETPKYMLMVCESETEPKCMLIV